MGNVGGDPESMTGGASTLSRVATNLAHAHGHVGAQTRAAGAAAGGDLAAAAARLAAALSTVLEDTGTQIDLASRLAANAATDLQRAGGQ